MTTHLSQTLQTARVSLVSAPGLQSLSGGFQRASGDQGGRQVTSPALAPDQGPREPGQQVGVVGGKVDQVTVVLPSSPEPSSSSKLVCSLLSILLAVQSLLYLL